MLDWPYVDDADSKPNKRVTPVNNRNLLVFEIIFFTQADSKPLHEALNQGKVLGILEIVAPESDPVAVDEHDFRVFAVAMFVEAHAGGEETVVAGRRRNPRQIGRVERLPMRTRSSSSPSASRTQ